MIDYAKVKIGDKLKIVGAGAPGFAKLGDIVEVISTDGKHRCDVKRDDGRSAYFAMTCGAQRLEPVPTPGLAPDPLAAFVARRSSATPDDLRRIGKIAMDAADLKQTAS